MQPKVRHKFSIALLLIAGAMTICPVGAAKSGDPDDLADKSLEELMNVDVTTVARKEQKLSKVPAAVYVVTQEAIQRSGATNIPDVLRGVPGVQVAQVEADRWAISIRGFNGGYSNKLLVLVDGRTIYTPSFSGVYWDQLDIPLDTIERIEVVRGSGGAVWGANAVNGVINIITMNSRDTQGGKAEIGSGSQQPEDFLGRFGGKIGTWGTYRVSGDYRNFNGFHSTYGPGTHDGWSMEHGGFRLDGRLSSKDQLAVDGDGFNTTGSELLGYAGTPALGVVAHPLSNDGFHILGKWTHTHSDNSESSLQIYDNQYQRDDTALLERSNTVDVDFQNRTAIGSRNDVVWGAGYRFTDEDAHQTVTPAQSLADIGFFITMVPEKKRDSLFSGFAQDEIALTKTLALTVGSKIEHNSYTGVEYEPTARVGWTPNEKNTLWAAASHAIRQPNRLETGVKVNFPSFPVAPGLLFTTYVAPFPKISAERSNTYEAGYRFLPNNRISLDIATFYSLYSALHVTAPQALTLTPMANQLLLAIGTQYAATGSATNYGSELSLTAAVTGRWKLTGNYSWLHDSSRTRSASMIGQELSNLFGSSAQSVVSAALGVTSNDTLLWGSTPRNAIGVQSYFDVTRKWSLDQTVSYVGELPAEGVPSYIRLDLHTSYKLPHGLQASLVGQNLLSSRHLEFEEPSQFLSTEPERSIFGKLTWTF